MTMIETVARAMCVSAGRNPDMLEPGTSVGNWTGEDGKLDNGYPAHFLWRRWAPTARAAIMAMRDPSEEMTEQGDASWGSIPNSIAIWQAMIDAALT